MNPKDERELTVEDATKWLENAKHLLLYGERIVSAQHACFKPEPGKVWLTLDLAGTFWLNIRPEDVLLIKVSDIISGMRIEFKPDSPVAKCLSPYLVLGKVVMSPEEKEFINSLP